MKTLDNFPVIDFIEEEIAAKSFPGAALLVAQNGKQILEYYCGTYCNGELNDIPLDGGVSHMFYSFSKGITATAIVLAHQINLIDYDAPLSTYIPEYRGGLKDLTTIRHLLTHSSGIPNCKLKAVATEEEWRDAVQTCCKAEVEWMPGSRTQYHSHSGTLLAAEAVRRCLDMRSWQDICSEWIFKPIGAKTLTFHVPEDRPVALTHQPDVLPCSISTAYASNLGHPGAGCFGGIKDIIKVLQFHLNSGQWNGRMIINPDELAEMHRVQYEDRIVKAEKSAKTTVHEPWGLGWLIKRNLAEHGFGFGNATSAKSFGHAGIDTVMALSDPEQHVAIAFIATGSLGKETARIRNKITDLVVESLS